MDREPPWRLDREELDAETVLALVRAQLPQLEGRAARPLASGYDCDAWLVDDTWVLRFPRRAETVQPLLREADLLRRVASHVDLPVPRIELRGEPGEGFPYPFTGYRFLPGVEPRSVAIRPEDHAPLAGHFGRFLTQLHSIPLGQQAGRGRCGSAAAPSPWAEQELERCGPILEKLLGQDADRWRPWWTGRVPAPPAYAGPPVLCHQDLAEEHILLDPRTRRLAAVIDWADAGPGDPMGDFMGLRVWLGEEFVARTLVHYHRPVDDGFSDRMRYMTRALVLLWAAHKHWREPGRPSQWLPILSGLEA